MKRKYTLKYLFEAVYADGSFYKQNQQDISIKFPPVLDENGEYQGKNCMSDVFDDIENGKTLRFFTLSGEGKTLTVDLGTGLFYVNGVKLLAESDKLPVLPEKFELIHYKLVDQNANVTYETKTGKILDVEDGETHVEYYIGWQCNIKGKNYTQKIAIS